jgi:acyl-CoA synthetase (AMP-forming)/AMP-acid ligase II
VVEGGGFRFEARKKEVVWFRGNHVPPPYLEALLLSHVLVADAGVCGVYDQERETEVPVGYVSLLECVGVLWFQLHAIFPCEHVDSLVGSYSTYPFLHHVSTPRGVLQTRAP